MQLQDREASAVDTVSGIRNDTGRASAETLWVILLIITGALLRIISFIFSDNTGGDAKARAALVAGWLQHPNLQLAFDGYLPGHFWLMAGVALFVKDVELAGRLLSLMLGIASLIAFWRLVRRVYGVSAGILSLAVFCLYSLHIAYSTTTSSEVSYLFFLILSLDLFFAFLQGHSGKLYQLVLSGICLSIAESIRFEAWVFGAGMFLGLGFLMFRGPNGWEWKNASRKLVIFGATAGAWPIMFMGYSCHVFHAPMYLVTWNSERVTEYLSRLSSEAVPRSYVLAVVPVALIVSISPLAFAAGVYGITRSCTNRVSGAFAALTLFFAAVQMYEIFSGASASTARYTLTLGTMFAAMAGWGLLVMTERVLTGRMAVARITVIGLLLANGLCLLAASEWANPYDEKFASVSPVLRYQHHVAIVGQYLRNAMAPGDAVVIDNYNFQSNVIAAAAGLPLLPGNRVYSVAKKNEVDVLQYIKSVHPRFLVYSDQGTLRNVINLQSACNGTEKIGEVEFRCTFETPKYRVYQLIYPPNAMAAD